MGVCKDVTVGSEVVVECDLERVTGTGGGSIVAIYESSLTLCNNPYCAWGQTASGDTFRCSWDTFDATLGEIVLVGSDQEDAMFFEDSDGSSMNVYAGYTGTLFHGRINGEDGNDWVVGANSISAKYRDILKGGNDDDHICAIEGDDSAAGDDGDDMVCGDEGDDLVQGGLGADTVCGGLGVDHLDGGGHADFLDHGSDAGDYNDGGPSSSDVCNSKYDTNCEDEFTVNECL